MAAIAALPIHRGVNAARFVKSRQMLIWISINNIDIIKGRHAT